MNEKETHEMKEESILDMFDKQYLEADNKEELDYWAPLSQIIMESLELRYINKMSQADLADKMDTRQSVISRFENMGRIPNYDFIARLAIALDQSPGMTLYGNYMAVVPVEKQAFIKKMACKENIPIKKYVENLLDNAITDKININIKYTTAATYLTAELNDRFLIPIESGSAPLVTFASNVISTGQKSNLGLVA